MLKVFERNGLKPDLVVGSSVGSLVGAFYAAGVPVERIERFGKRMKQNTLRDWIFPKLGAFGGAGIRRFIVDRIGDRTIPSLEDYEPPEEKGETQK